VTRLFFAGARNFSDGPFAVVAKHWKERRSCAITRYANSCIPYLISQWVSFGLCAIRAAFGRDILANQVKIFIVEHNSIVAAARQTLLRKREQPF
jgi:hypothetical protein